MIAAAEDYGECHRMVLGDNMNVSRETMTYEPPSIVHKGKLKQFAGSPPPRCDDPLGIVPGDDCR